MYPGDWGKNNLKRAFARGEWRSGGQNLLINAGVIYEDATIGGGNLSPMASINYLFGDSGSLRVSYSEAYRYPVLFEEKANALIYGVIPFIVTTGDLDPVKIRSYDLGLRNRYGKLRYELRLFREEIDDLIVVQEIGDVNLFRNSDWAEITGIEVQLESRIDWLGSRLTANYAYTQIDSDDIDAKVSESAPRHNGSVLLIHRSPDDWTLSESFTYMSSVTHLSWDPVPVVRRLDARLKKTWRIGDTGSLSLSLAALNLLEQDAYIQPVEDRGREYRAEIAMEF